MYIHNYQIHNVLNEYRKQLTRGPAPPSKSLPAQPVERDRVVMSDQAQRQLIIDQVSSDIVERIKQSNMQRAGDRHPENRPSGAPEGRRTETSRDVSEFTYTLIDEFNRKVTNKLPVRNLTPLSGPAARGAGAMGGISAEPPAS